MAGHSKFKNIMHRKGAQDKLRAKAFTKLVREIFVAAKIGGSDLVANHRLKTAIQDAKANNMPKENIERALKKATEAPNSESYEELRYEGYSKEGIAIIVEALTDNKNRTAAEVRHVFNKYGGSLGGVGSVSFLFDRLGVTYIVGKDDLSFDTIFNWALDANAQDVEELEDGFVVISVPELLGSITHALYQKYSVDRISAQLIWSPKSPIQSNISEDYVSFIDALEELDDTQKVFTNLAQG